MADGLDIKAGSDVLDQVLDEVETEGVEETQPLEYEEPGFDEEPEQTEETEEAPESTEAKAEEGEKEAEPDPTDERLSNLEKRFKDTQRSWHTEHEAKLKLEKELQELREASAEKPADFSQIFGDPDDPMVQAFGQLSSTVEGLKESFHEQQAQAKQQAALREWEKAEAPLKGEHDDYDTVVSEIFSDAFEKDERVKQEFLEKGGTPQAAYEIGQRLQSVRELEQDPSGFIEKLRQQVREEMTSGQEVDTRAPGEPEVTKSQKGKTLASMNSQTSTPKRSSTPNDPLDAFFAGQHKT